MCSMESCLQLYLYTNKWITANYLTAPEFLTIKSKIRHVKPQIKNNNNKYIDTLIQLRTLASVAVTGSAKANRRLTFQTGNFDQLNRDVKNKLLFFFLLSCFLKRKKIKQPTCIDKNTISRRLTSADMQIFLPLGTKLLMYVHAPFLT